MSFLPGGVSRNIQVQNSLTNSRRSEKSVNGGRSFTSSPVFIVDYLYEHPFAAFKFSIAAAIAALSGCACAFEAEPATSPANSAGWEAWAHVRIRNPVWLRTDGSAMVNGRQATTPTKSWQRSRGLTHTPRLGEHGEAIQVPQPDLPRPRRNHRAGGVKLLRLGTPS